MSIGHYAVTMMHTRMLQTTSGRHCDVHMVFEQGAEHRAARPSPKAWAAGCSGLSRKRVDSGADSDS